LLAGKVKQGPLVVGFHVVMVRDCRPLKMLFNFYQLHVLFHLVHRNKVAVFVRFYFTDLI